MRMVLLLFIISGNNGKCLLNTVNRFSVNTLRICVLLLKVL